MEYVEHSKQNMLLVIVAGAWKTLAKKMKSCRSEMFCKYWNTSIIRQMPIFLLVINVDSQIQRELGMNSLTS